VDAANAASKTERPMSMILCSTNAYTFSMSNMVALRKKAPAMPRLGT